MMFSKSPRRVSITGPEPTQDYSMDYTISMAQSVPFESYYPTSPRARTFTIEQDTSPRFVLPSIFDHRDRVAAEMEPTPIGPRVNVVDRIQVQDISALHKCKDILVETLIPGARKRGGMCTDPSSIERQVPNKKQKLVAAAPFTFLPSCVEKGSVLEADLDSSTSSGEAGPKKRIITGSDRWYEKYEELCLFHKKYGHCLVPIKTPDGESYQTLSQWVKRQRHQHKLKTMGRTSTLTADREAALRKLNFVWDSHGAIWNERFVELLEFRAARGHCNVPTMFPENPQLSIWVKCQRRQYKLHVTGKKSNINAFRIAKLNEINFVWNPRNLSLTL